MSEEKNWNAIEEYVVRRLQTLEAKVEQLTDELNQEREAKEIDHDAFVFISANMGIYEFGDRYYISTKMIQVTKSTLWLAKALGLAEGLKDEKIQEG